MDVDDFPLPPYGAKKLARHGAAIERLMLEREQGIGEFADHSLVSALGFDAADFVWAALMTVAPAAQQTREVRNMLAETIIRTIEGWDDLPSELRAKHRA